MSDPVCVVEAIGKKQNTNVFPKTTICTWDKLFFFEYNLTAAEFLNGKVKIYFIF